MCRSRGAFSLFKSEYLQVPIRRIYDVTGVLEGVGLLQHWGRCAVRWTPWAFMAPSMEEECLDVTQLKVSRDLGLQAMKVRLYHYFDESVGGEHGSRRENTGTRGQHQSYENVLCPQKQIVYFSRGCSESVCGK